MAIIVVVTSVWGYKFLRGQNLLKPTNNYFVRYSDIDQLAATSPVLIRGLNVGTVSELRLDKDMKTIIATLNIKRGIRIPADAKAVVISTGIMGGRAVELRIDGPCEGDDCAKPGSYLEGHVQGFFDTFLDPGEGGTLAKVKENISEILQTLGDSLTSPSANNEIAKTYTQLSHLITNLASITGTMDKSMNTYDRHIQATLSNVSTLTGALADNQDKIANSIAHLESITRQFDEAQIGTNAGVLLTDVQALVKELDATMLEANAAMARLADITEDLEAGKGSLGKLLKDEEFYDNTAATMKNMELLLQDFRLNPKRYVNVSVFGKKQKDYNVPEDDPAFVPDSAEQK